MKTLVEDEVVVNDVMSQLSKEMALTHKEVPRVLFLSHAVNLYHIKARSGNILFVGKSHFPKYANRAITTVYTRKGKSVIAPVKIAFKKRSMPCTQAAGETPTLPEAAPNNFVAFVKKAALLLSVSSFGEKRTFVSSCLCVHKNKKNSVSL